MGADIVSRPADKYEQRLERIAAELRRVVADHENRSDHVGCDCESLIDAIDNEIDTCFAGSEVPAFMTECPYLWEWTPNGNAFVSESVRDAALDALRYDARERLYTFDFGGLTLLDPEATWKPTEELKA